MSISSSIGSTERMPSLASLVDWTASTYDLISPAALMVDLALQVAQMARYAPGVPWIYVGGATEGGIPQAAAARGVRTIGLGYVGDLLEGGDA